MIVLFAGTGDNAQYQLSVGIGTLAGSTIMLLTIPWFLSIIGGRVNIIDGKANYRVKLDPIDNYSLFYTGIKISKAARTGAVFMLVTCIPYLFIQIPGLMYLNTSDDEIKSHENLFSLIGSIIAFCGLLVYLVYQYLLSRPYIHHPEFPINLEDNALLSFREEYIKNALLEGNITLLGFMTEELNSIQRHLSKNDSFQLQPTESTALRGRPMIASDIELIAIHRFKSLLKPFFNKYDFNNNGTLDIHELTLVFKDLGEDITAKSDKSELLNIFKKMDADNSGTISYDEFVNGITEFVLSNHLISAVRKKKVLSHPYATEPKGSNSFEISIEADDKSSTSGFDDDSEKLIGITNYLDKSLVENEDGEDDEEVMPTDLLHLSPSDQQYRIKLRSLYMMAIGTFIVVVIADPMVDIISEIGDRTSIPSFYVAFVVAPIASNASELIASYHYSLKKTSNSISVSLSALQGAAIMNNTLVLGVFLTLIYSQKLEWEFFAETTTILFIQILMVLMSYKRIHTIFDGFVILSFYPLALTMVYFLEFIGWD